MMFRLESMVDNDPPTRQGIDAEHILVKVAYDPAALLSQDLIKCLFSLRQPLSYITEEERLTLQKLATVADGGLSSAVHELANLPEQVENMRDVRVLRVALAIIEGELNANEEGEWRVLKTVWGEGFHGITLHLANAFSILSNVIKDHFNLRYPPQSTQEFVNQLFRVASEVLQLSNRFIPSQPLPPRALRKWTASVADLFACTDAADMVLDQASSACVAAQEARQTCIDAMRILSTSDDFSEEKSVAEIVFRALLVHGHQPGNFDPVYHLLQVSCLLDYLIPFPDPDDIEQDEEIALWFRRVIPNALEDLRAFIRVLDPENKAHIVKRLINLDNGVIGVGEWLIMEDLKQLSQLLKQFDEDLPYDAHRYQAVLHLRLIRDLIVPSSSVSQWCITFIESTPEAAEKLSWCLSSLLSRRFSSHHMTEIAYTLAAQSTLSHDGLRSALCIALLRAAQGQNISPQDLQNDLSLAWDLLNQNHHIISEGLSQEICGVVSSLEPAQIPDEAVAISIAQILEWLTYDGLVTLPGLTESHLQELFKHLDTHISQDRLVTLRSQLSFSEDMLDLPIINPLPTKLEFSVDEIERIMHPKSDQESAVPSTPPLKPQGQDVIGLVNISPSTILRSPLVTGLTKTYLKNDFRQLRQSTATRQNTSRLPSMHVDVSIFIR